MYLTRDQQYLMSILKETRCLTRRQALRLLRARTPQKEEAQVDAALRQLRYLGRIRPLDERVIALAEDGGRAADRGMLEAVDVMLDLCGRGLEDLSARRPPFKLVFLTTLDDGTISVFAVLPVEPGREGEAVTRLEVVPAEPHQSVIFLLSDLSQRALISVQRPHYFAVRDNGRLRYFKGGGG